MTHRTLDEYLKQAQTIVHTTAKQPTTRPKYRITGFYKETEFQETPIGKIPKEWKIVKLLEFVNILPGYPFSSKYYNNDNRGLPLIRIRDLGKDKTEVYYDGPYSQEYIVKSGDILISMDGEFESYLWKGPTGLLNQRILKIWPKDNNVLNKLFLYYIIKKPLKIIENSIVGTTVKHLLKKHLESLRIPLPSYEEQWGIAEVLSALDRAIEATERLIWRLKRLKRGLMQELLTKGIGHKEFQETPIGKIPKEWKIVSLADVAEYINGYPFKPSEWSDNGLPIVRIQNLNDPSKLFNYYNGPLSSKHKEVIINNEDLLFAWSASFGFYMWNRGRAILNQHIYKVKPKYSIIDKYFLYYVGNHYLNAYVKTHTVGSTMKHIRKSTLKSIRIPLPPLEEQKQIVTILSNIDEWIEIEKKRKENIERLKRGLMELLLTGRVRVRVERLDDMKGSSAPGGVAVP